MENILKIDKIFCQKILNHKQNIFFNHSTKLLINIISNNIKEIILKYHFLEVIELEQLKNKLVINLLKLRNKNYYDIELSNIYVDLIKLVSEINYPFNIGYSSNNYNNFSNFNKNTSVKFYYKPYSQGINNNFYNNAYTILSPIQSNTLNDNDNYLFTHPYSNSNSNSNSSSDSDYDDEYIYIHKQRKIVKNYLSNNSIDNYMIQSIMKNQKNILMNKKNNIDNSKKNINIFVNKKENPKEYKIVSKNVSFDWNKSFISI